MSVGCLTGKLTRRFLVTILTVVTLVWLGLLGVPAQAQYFGRNKVQTQHLKWKTLYTPHFEILHYAGAEELAVRASIIAEQAYREYANRLQVELPWRVPFILYASHNDFSQTNISDQLIGEGTGGFSEPFRNRMVLPYNGSHADFVHVIRHELVHVFMFYVAFGSSDPVGRSTFFNIPLWFAEGIAEWLSSGWDGTADMFIRDATINDYLQPLEYVGGFMVYKQGQAAMRLLSERYGEQKLVDFWKLVGRMRSVEGALSRVYGLKMEDFNNIYRKSLRRRYWKTYGDLEEPDEIARALTDHVEEHAYYNERPALSPLGDRLAFFSDRDGLPSLYVMSAIDGEVQGRLVEGYRSSQFESVHSFESDISFDPSGSEIAFIAKTGNRETLHTIAVRDGKVTRSYQLDLDVASSPAWSPDGRSIVLVGTRHGRTDLYLVDLEGTVIPELYWAVGTPWDLDDGVRIVRLTDDVGDESGPAWSLDGSRLAYSFNSRAEIDFEFEVDAEGNRRLLWARPDDVDTTEDGRVVPGGTIVLLDLANGRSTELFAEEHGRRDPIWIDDRTLCVVNDYIGISNLSLVTLDPTGTRVAGERMLTNVLGGITRLTYSAAADRLVFSAFRTAGWDLFAADSFRQQWSQREPRGNLPQPVTLEPPAVVMVDSLQTDLVDPERVGLVEPYRTRFSLDTSQAGRGGAIYFNSAVGLGMANVLTLSDMLGNHRLVFLLNFYGSFENSDLAVSYYNLSRRVNTGFGIFHYDNFYNSVITNIGELLPRDSFFRERRYGVFGLLSYPFNSFERISFELQVFNSQRTTFEWDPTGSFLVEGPKVFTRLAAPSISYTHDSALYGPFGPVMGTRFTVGYAPSMAIGGSGLDRRTAVIDWRKYWMPWRRNTFALRLMGAVSDGADPRVFVLGGPFTLRGYDFYDYETISNLAGTRLGMMNLEYRLPLLDYLIFGWPGRWGFSNIGATLFFDVGAAWTDDIVAFGYNADNRWGFQDLRGDYGFGIRTLIGFLPLRFDWAWRTDLRTSSTVRFQFSIGPEF